MNSRPVKCINRFIDIVPLISEMIADTRKINIEWCAHFHERFKFALIFIDLAAHRFADTLKVFFQSGKMIMGDGLLA